VFTDADGAPIELPDTDLAPEAVGAVLERGEIEIIGRMPFSSNGTFLSVVRSESDAVAAIYKPQQTERPLWDFPEGTLYRREVASYALSEALGWGIVPPTVVRDEGPLGVGSVQQFFVHDPEEHYFTLLEGREDRFREFAAFDVIANNTDRKGGHCLRVLRDDRVVGIDHGLTFNAEWKLRTVIWDFAGESIPDRLRADLERIAGELPSVLGAHLSALEVEATALRLGEFLAGGRFLVPTDDYRSYPWPLV
jgi:uncharacterized repeat protein (TIGR03843 family)